MSLIPNESANLTRATSSGELAWNSLYSGFCSSGKTGVTLWQTASAVMKSLAANYWSLLELVFLLYNEPFLSKNWEAYDLGLLLME